VKIASSRLKFSVITEEDEGVYHCIATNHDGSVISNNTTITVYGELLFSFLYNVSNPTVKKVCGPKEGHCEKDVKSKVDAKKWL